MLNTICLAREMEDHADYYFLWTWGTRGRALASRFFVFFLYCAEGDTGMNLILFEDLWRPFGKIRLRAARTRDRFRDHAIHLLPWIHLHWNGVAGVSKGWGASARIAVNNGHQLLGTGGWRNWIATGVFFRTARQSHHIK
eukprot:gene14048-biopygen544